VLFAEIQEWHAAFVEAFNPTPHWAYPDRAEGRCTPVKVVGWVRGQSIEAERLHRVPRPLQVECIVHLRR